MTQASRYPDYYAFTNSIRLPFTNIAYKKKTPSIAVKVNGVEIDNVGLDSGSTIFALSKKFVPAFQKEDKSIYERGYVEYTSGHKYVGFWFPVEVSFFDKGTKVTATSKINALVVIAQFMNGIRIPEEKEDEVHYMGIGFGKKIEDKSEYIPRNNALLNIVEFYGEDGTQINGSFRHGYILHNDSVEIGLTAKNTESFNWTKLTNLQNPEYRWYWDRVNIALRVKDHIKDSGWMLGSILIDTGLPYMDIGNPQYVANPNISGDDKTGPLDITIRFTNVDTSLPEFSLKWPGNKEAWLPTSINHHRNVYPTSFVNPAFVNPGQHFYNKFSTMFDADEGYWGIREIQPSQRCNRSARDE